MVDLKVSKILFTEDEIRKRVKELASRISEDYADKEVVLIGVLKGAVYFLSDLSKNLSIPHMIDFISVSSYKGSQRGTLRLLMDTRIDIKGKDVIIVEDIVDTGLTLKEILKIVQAKEPKSVKVCVVVSKPNRRKVDVRVDYVGFTIPDVWVVGYGLDYDEWGRHFPFIGVLENVDSKT
ncbi:MAG: hypoxanthine phosphoribosyltransferase [Candidatus Aenigmarchaeota archaeon]|nr:hypoxanthine phosphoribosyltransferase [Candidatus Aenigmarchaeota archaeon]